MSRFTTYTSTTNACKLCTPLGATLVFKGIEGGVPFLHGSQGCATYMRRYIISHFREPMDIASSALGEKHAVYGGGPNLKKGILNVMKKYNPALVGVASTCLTETIGDDVARYLFEFRKEFADLELPEIVHVSTPSYMGTHMEGFHKAVYATVAQLCTHKSSGAEKETTITGNDDNESGTACDAEAACTFSGRAVSNEMEPDKMESESVSGPTSELASDPISDLSPEYSVGQNSEPTSDSRVNVFSGMISPQDLRNLRDWCEDFGLTPIILPDYSETLDGTAKMDYEPIPTGGTPVADIVAMPDSAASLTFGRVLAPDVNAGKYLEKRFNVPEHTVGLPIGLRESDAMFNALSAISGRPIPRRHTLERGRLVDAFVDAHKYVYGKRVIVYGEEDLVVGLTSLLAEIGAHPVLVATGASGCNLHTHIEAVCDGLTTEMPNVREGVDFHEIAEEVSAYAPDLMVGHSKGYRYARDWNIPLIRAGFPIHDRFGGQRFEHLGYKGALSLLDRIVNAVLEKKQSDSPIGWGYL